jgi:hypothetical protein
MKDVSLSTSEGGTVKREDSRLLELAGDLLAHKETVVLLVRVEIEILRQLVVPIDLEADGLKGVEPRVGVA